MSYTSILIVFIITAVFGIWLISYVRKGERRPLPLVIAHGIFAVSAYCMLIYRLGFDARSESNIPLDSVAFTFFSFAAVLGFTMLITDKILNKAIPKWIPLVHGGLAATGLVIMIIAAFTGN